jgi:hypothetical protein
MARLYPASTSPLEDLPAGVLFIDEPTNGGLTLVNHPSTLQQHMGIWARRAKIKPP